VHPMANRTSFDSFEGARSNEPVAGAHRPLTCDARAARRAWGLLVPVERMGPAEARPRRTRVEPKPQYAAPSAVASPTWIFALTAPSNVQRQAGDELVGQRDFPLPDRRLPQRGHQSNAPLGRFLRRSRLTLLARRRPGLRSFSRISTSFVHNLLEDGCVGKVSLLQE
jgi:hypothetical protein